MTYDDHMTKTRENTLPKINWLSVTEVAEYLEMSRMTIYRWIREGKLPARQFGRGYRIDESDVKALLAGAVFTPDQQ